MDTVPWNEPGVAMTGWPDNRADFALRATLDRIDVGIVIFSDKLSVVVYNHAFDLLSGQSDKFNRVGAYLPDILRSLSLIDKKEGEKVVSMVESAVKLRDERGAQEMTFGVQSGQPVRIRLFSLGNELWSLQFVISPTPSTLDLESCTDPLTGLYNRKMLSQQLTRACEKIADGTEGFVVMAVDLDRFKKVNDTLGHAIGDALLCTVSQRLRLAVRAEDIICRTGGDEFVILQRNHTDGDASSAAARIVELIHRPFLLHGHVVNIGASVGIARAPNDAADPDSLLVQADLALYQAKTNGRGTFDFFRPELQVRAQERRTLEQDLRKALMLRQFELYYQPQIDVDNGSINGFAALLQWRHPKRGVVAPTVFLPVLKEIGLALAVGDWVLKAACAEAARWPEGYTVAVSISASQFESDHLVASVTAALAASGLPAGRLEIEVSETALLDHTEATRATMFKLRAMGIQIAMDEFGTGYSSMSQLRSFPFSRIKIDRSFVDNAAVNGSDAAIMRTIGDLGKILGIRTTAEGIKSAAQLEKIRAEGCNDTECYILGHPVRESEVTAIISLSENEQAIPTSQEDGVLNKVAIP